MKKLNTIIGLILINILAYAYGPFVTSRYNVESDFPDSANHNGNLFGAKIGTKPPSFL